MELIISTIVKNIVIVIAGHSDGTLKALFINPAFAVAKEKGL